MVTAHRNSVEYSLIAMIDSTEEVCSDEEMMMMKIDNRKDSTY